MIVPVLWRPAIPVKTAEIMSLRDLRDIWGVSSCAAASKPLLAK